MGTHTSECQWRKGGIAARVSFLRQYGLPIGLVTIGIFLSATSPLGVFVAVGLGAFLLYMLRAPGTSLCETCRFNDPRHCMRPERPRARQCAGYDKGPPPPGPRGHVVAFRPPPGEA